MVVKQGCVLVGLGLLVGLAGALGAVRLLRSLLHGTEAYDLATFGIVPLVLAAVSLLACYLPARRAAGVDPMITLRSE
jgi:ABC-type lipoprotein release transport system permease subunit